jgi:hypothetical protein
VQYLSADRQDATMVDLLREAERAGERATAFVHEQIAAAFESWINRQDLREITGEEMDDLREAFEQGCGMCVHDLSADRQDQA